MSVFDDIIAKLERIQVEGVEAQKALESLKTTANNLKVDYDKTSKVVPGSPINKSQADYLPYKLDKLVDFNTRLMPYQGVDASSKSKVNKEIYNSSNMLETVRAVRELNLVLKELNPEFKSKGLQPPEAEAMFSPKSGASGQMDYINNKLKLSPEIFARGVGTTVAHEFWHYMEIQLKRKDLSTNNPKNYPLSTGALQVADPNVFSESLQGAFSTIEELSPAIRESTFKNLKNAGVDEDSAKETAEYRSNPNEIFARTMTEIGTTNKPTELINAGASLNQIAKIMDFYYKTYSEYQKIVSKIESVSKKVGDRAINTSTEKVMSYNTPTFGKIVKRQVNLTPYEIPEPMPSKEGVRQLLREKITTIAVSGTPDPNKVEELINKLEGGSDLSNRQRLGGGSRLTRNKETIAEIKQLVDTLKILEGEYSKVAQEAEKSAEVQVQEVSKVAQEVEKSASPDSTRSQHINEKTAEALKKQSDAIQKLREERKIQIEEQSKQRGRKDTSNIYGIKSLEDYPRESIEKLDAQLKEATNSAAKFESTTISIQNKVKGIGEGWKEVTRIIQGAEKKEKVSATSYLSPTGDVFNNKKDYERKRYPNVGTFTEVFPTLKESMNPDQYKVMEQIFVSSQGTFDKINRSVVKTAFSSKILNNEWIAIEKTMTDSAGETSKLTAYIDKLGNAYTKAGYDAKQLQREQRSAAEKNAQYLASDPNAAGALQLIKKRGFGVQDIRSVSREEPSGITKIDVEKYDKLNNIVSKLRVGYDRWGGVINMTNRRFLDFTESIVRNTQEIFRWSIGVGLLYGTMYRLQNLIKLAIDNETKLADISITLGRAQRDLNKIFDEAADVAIKTGESINGVLESYKMAYSAAGGVIDPMRRATVAQTLLTDATILNKLSGLDAAESIDVLSGSLRQIAPAGMDAATALEQGANLLDKWVALSNKSGVELSALATAFSVTAESAKNSGMEIEEINAVIATLSEKIGGLGGKETGNAVRALIGGVYQDQAANALANYGIAVKDTEGEMRDFLDISRDIFELYNQGSISADQLNKLAYVLGGGVRRGQQYVAFLTDLNRVQENVAAQADAGGSAQEALARKMNTTQTSITQMSNAMQSLAQTIGSEGGILDGFQSLLTVGTGLVNILDAITGALGKLTVPVALLSILALYEKLGGTVAQRKGKSFFGVNILPPQMPNSDLAMGDQEILMGGAPPRSRFSAMTRSAKNSVTGFARNYGMGMGMGGLMAMSRYSEAGGGVEGAEQAATVFAGGVMGTLMAGGNPIGGVIGAAIADTFVKMSTDPKGVDEFSIMFRAARDKAFGETKEEPLPEDVEKKVSRAFQLIGNYRQAGESLFAKDLNKVGGFQRGGLEGAGRFALSTEAFLKGKKIEDSPEFVMDELRKIAESGDKEAIALLKEFEAYLSKGSMPLARPEDYTIYKEQGKATTDKGAEVDAQLEEITKNIDKMYLERDIKPKEKRDLLADLPSVSGSFANIWAVLNSDLADANSQLQEMKPNVEEVVNVMAYAGREDKDIIATLTTSLIDLEKKYQELMPGSADRVQVVKDINTQEKALASLLMLELDLIKEQNSERTKANLIPSIDIEGIRSPQDWQMGMQRAKDLQMRDFKAQQESKAKLGEVLTDEEVNEMINNAQPFLVDAGKSAGFFIAQGLIDQGYITEAFKQLAEEGKVILGSAVPYSFSDYSAQQITQAANSPEYWAMNKAIEGLGGGSEAERSTPEIIFPEDSMNPIYMKRDWKIVQYLLGRILDVGEKQLEGIYNLPGGSSFYVPFDAYKMGAGGSGGGGGGGGITGGKPLQTIEEKLAEPMPKDWKATQESIYGKEAATWLITGKGPEQPTEIPNAYEELMKNMQKPTQFAGDDFRDMYGLRTQEIQKPFEEKDLSYLDKFKLAIEGLTKSIESGITAVSGEDNKAYKERIESGDPNSNIIRDLFNWLNKLIVPQVTPQGQALPGVGENKPMTISMNPDIKINPQPIKVNFNTTTMLAVDGRLIASVIMPYLYQAMVANEAVAGAATRRYTFV